MKFTNSFVLLALLHAQKSRGTVAAKFLLAMSVVRFSREAFTLIEMLCVIAIIGVLSALVLPALARGQARAKRVECLNNLREMGVAFHGFMHDHNSRFPMEVPAREGGSLEFVQGSYQLAGRFYFGYQHFRPLANELGTPQILVCPSDTRQAATNFPTLRNANLSYFVGVTAQYLKPDTILSGDRNLTNDWAERSSLLHAATSPLRWTAQMHQFRGNLLFSDAHVEEENDVGLILNYKQRAEVQDIVLPTIPRGAVPAAILTPATRIEHPRGLAPAGQSATAGNHPDAFPSVSSGGSGTFPNGIGSMPTAGARARTQSNTTAISPPAQAGKTPRAGSEESPFIQGFVTTARELVKGGAWMLWLLLLLLAAILLTIYARGRSHVRRR